MFRGVTVNYSHPPHEKIGKLNGQLRKLAFLLKKIYRYAVKSQD